MRSQTVAMLAGGISLAALGVFPVSAHAAPGDGAQRSAVASKGGDPAAANARQPASKQESAIGEIIVTAQKRKEDIQTVPISITALTGSALQATQVNNISDLANSIPNVQINTFSNSPDSAVFTIRGIGVNDADPYVGTTVSVVVDGVVMGVNTSALATLFDIQRVEVLRGPQGTLFGANTTGGVINVITKQPTGVAGADFHLSYGNYNSVEADAAINFPITDSLAGKISFLHLSNDGYFRNYANNQRLGRKNLDELRAYLKYEAGNYNATVIGEYDRSRNGSQTGIMIAGPGDLFYVPGQTTHPFDFKRGQSLDQPDLNNRDTYSITLTQHLDSGSAGNFTSITNYRQYDNNLYSDDDATTLVLLQTHRHIKHHQFSEEFRDEVNLTTSTQATLGVFFFDQAYSLDQQGKLDGFLPGLGQPQTQYQHNWSISGFAQFYQYLTNKLQLQAGFRYSHETTSAKSTTANTFNPSGVATFHDPIIPGTLVVATGKKSWNNEGWKIGLNYQARPALMFYGYWARGFKSGGFTGRIAIAQDIGPFNPEKVDTFELGVKSEWLDHHLRLNADVFLNEYRDMQVVQNITYPDGKNSASIANAGRSVTKGFELELTAVPVDGLTLNGSLAYLDAYYLKYNTQVLDPNTGGLVPVSYAGNRLMNSPEWSGSAGFTWKTALGDGTFSFTGQYDYTSSKYTGYTNSPQELVGPINLVNASMSWSPNKANWKIGAFARNLFDEKYFNQKLNLAGIGTLASIGDPRTYGVTFDYSF